MDQAKAQVVGYYQSWVDFPQPKKMKILKGIAFGCFSLFLLFVVIYGFGGTGKKSATIPNIVVFTEAMPYDLLALRYLSKRRDVAISMIVLTLNSWTTDMNAGYKNVQAFMTLLQNEGFATKVPVYYGHNVALVDINRGTQNATYSGYISQSLHTLANNLFGAAHDLNTVNVGETTMEFFEEPLKQYLQSNKAKLLVMGSCTDAAWFLEHNEAVRKNVNGLFVAGGAFNSVGDMQYMYSANTVAEVNFFMDPEAAQYILSGAHGRDVTLFPLDSTYTWNETSYRSLITSEISSSDRSSVTSALIVAEGLDGYYRSIDFPARKVSTAVMAASYMSDVYLQNGAQVAIMPVNVRNGGAMVNNGQSYRPPSGDSTVMAVLKVNEVTFFDHLVRVGALKY